MKLDERRLGTAAALAGALLYAICWVLVVLAPEVAMRITTYMLHMDVSSLPWSMTVQSLAVGVLGWGTSAGVGGWLLATLYNRLGAGGQTPAEVGD